MAEEKKIKTKKSENSSDAIVVAIGRRKSATARVRLVLSGKGDVMINDRTLTNYFALQLMQDTVVAPFETVGRKKDFDVTAKVRGGGLIGQCEAVRLGIARALVKLDEKNKPALRAAGFLTRDPREKERKKFGLKKARRAPQWGKR